MHCLCGFYPGICLTTEENARENLSQGKKNLSQGKKNLSQGKKNLSQGKKNLSQCKKNLSQGKKNLRQGKKNLGQGKKNLGQDKTNLGQGKKTSVRVRKTSVGVRKTSVRVRKTSVRVVICLIMGPAHQLWRKLTCRISIESCDIAHGISGIVHLESDVNWVLVWIDMAEKVICPVTLNRLRSNVC